MPKDLNSTGRWLMKRLTQGLAPEVQDRKDLLAVLREAGERGLVDGDALTMLEGGPEGGALQRRAIMGPRAQMGFGRRDEPAARIPPAGGASGHSRFPEFNEYFGARLSEAEGVDTVAGLLMKELGRLPRRGESASIGGFEFRVLRTDRRRIDALRVVAPRDVLPPDERAAGA